MFDNQKYFRGEFHNGERTDNGKFYDWIDDPITDEKDEVFKRKTAYIPN